MESQCTEDEHDGARTIPNFGIWDEAKPHKEASIRLSKRLGTNPSKRTTAPSNDNNSLSVHPVSIVATSLGGESTNIVLTTTR